MKIVSAYVMDKDGLRFRSEDAAQLNQLNFSFALIRDGALTGEHWRSIDAYKAYIAEHPHILPVLSVGGWGADGFSQAAATEHGRQLFVDSAIELMQTHGFLGLDIDWEYPGSSAGGIASSPDDRENFTRLMQALRAGLDRLTKQDKRKRLLACALGASSSLVENIDCYAIGHIANQINLMTYDMYRPYQTCHHTALYANHAHRSFSADEAVQCYTAAGLPAEKIMLGCAMYGRVYELTSVNDKPLYAASPSTGTQTIAYHALLNDPSYRFYFDEEAKASYALSKQSFVSCDTAQSIACKRDYVQAKGLMGLMCWEYSSDAEGALLRAMHGASETAK